MHDAGGYNVDDSQTDGGEYNYERPRRSKRGLVGLVVAAILVAVVLGGAGWFVAKYLFNPVEDSLKVGSCVTMPSPDSQPVTADCSDSSAMTYVIASSGEGKPKCADTQQQIYLPLVKKNAGGATTGFYCLAPNLTKNECYNLQSPITKVSCSDPSASVKVLDRISKANASECATTGGGLSYPELNLTFCLGQPK